METEQILANQSKIYNTSAMPLCPDNRPSKPSYHNELSKTECLGGHLSRYDKQQLQFLVRAKLGSIVAGWPMLSAEAVIKKAIDRHEVTAIGWSGGMCSTVVVDIARKYDPDIMIFFTNTLIEFPENVRYVYELVKLWDLNFVELRPDTTYWKIVEAEGWPKPRTEDTREPACCENLKYKPRREFFKKEHIKVNLTGLRASESDMRVNHAVRFGQIYDIQKGAMTVYQPILYWSPVEVEMYFRMNNIPRNDVYLTQERNGCMWCPAHTGWEDSIFNWSPCAYKWICKKMGVKPQSRLAITNPKSLTVL